jgi:hypothetical protein
MAVPTLATIATEVQSYKLFIITDGSYDYMSRQGSQAIAITNGRDLLWLGAGPCLGNGIAMNQKNGVMWTGICLVFGIMDMLRSKNTLWFHYLFVRF